MSSTLRAKAAVAALAAATAAFLLSANASAFHLTGGPGAQEAVASYPPAPTATVTAPPPPTAPPPSSPTAAPTLPPDPTPTPGDEQCPTEPLTPQALRAFAQRLAPMVGPVTCEDIHSIITVSWDGTKIKVVMKPSPDFTNGKCELVKASVKAVQPNNAAVKDDGSVEVPYDKDKKEKITIKIEYDFKCTVGDLVITLKKVVTIEFTPPDGPVVIKNKNRP